MKKLYYSIQALRRSLGSNLIKLLSLTLGLLIGVLIFTLVAYELSYDSFYEESDHIVMLRASRINQGVPEAKYDYTLPQPAAVDLTEALPDLVEVGSAVMNFMTPNIYHKDKKLEDVNVVYVDTLFFETMGLRVLEGNPTELASPKNIFISEGIAKKLFGDESPIGRILTIDKLVELTIRGIYQDVPGNTVLPHNIVASMALSDSQFGRGTWEMNDMYYIFFRLKRAQDIKEMNQRVQKAVEQYTETEKNGVRVEYSVIPLRKMYLLDSDSRHRILIMCILGFSVFFVSIMNYVLISVASFGRRAKMVGVHKCNGAGGKDVLDMFMYETGLIVLGGIALCFLLVFNFRDGIEDMLQISLSDVFVWKNLWVGVLTVLLLFLVSGFLPGYLFANVPVSHVFRRYSQGKRGWKRSLLFAEFVGVSFIGGILMVVMFQYYDLMNRDIGFHTEELAVVKIRADSIKNIEDEIRRQPFAEKVFNSSHVILSHYNAQPMVATNGDVICPLHFMLCSKEYPRMMGMTLLEGQWPQRNGDVIVGEEVVKKMKWYDGAVGKKLPIASLGFLQSKGIDCNIVGVVKDVRNMNFFIEQTCVSFITLDADLPTINVLLKEPFDDNLVRLNYFMKENYPQIGIEFISCRSILEEIYGEVNVFRNIVGVTSVCILFIVLMGLIGYINDETQRRSKEIAIRKVNGAEASGILRLFIGDIIKLGAGAVLIGIVFSYYISSIWIGQFADCQPIHLLWFVAIALGILLLIVLCVIFKVWCIANDNPVNSIKSE